MDRVENGKLAKHGSMAGELVESLPVAAMECERSYPDGVTPKFHPASRWVSKRASKSRLRVACEFKRSNRGFQAR